MGKPSAPPVSKLCNNQDAVKFVKDFQPEAADIAKTVNVPVEFILGLVAQETQYGLGDAAKNDNNYYSLHAPAPGQSGARPAKGDPKVMIAQFDTPHDSGLSFLKKYGPVVKNAASPKDFAQQLVKAGFNSGNSDTGGRDGFVDYLVGVINNVKVRMSCP